MLDRNTWNHFNCVQISSLLSSSSHTGGKEFGDFLVIHPYHLLLQAAFLGCIWCLHRSDVSKYLLVSQYWHIHMQECITEGPLWVHRCFFNNAPYVLFVLFVCKIRGKWLYKCCFLGSVASRIYLKQRVVFTCCFHRAFSQSILLASK